jgi:hypothetical protein
MTPERIDDPRDQAAQPCAAANPAGASRWPSLRPVGRVAELGALGVMVVLFTRERSYGWFGVIFGEVPWEEWTVKLPS